MKAITRFVLIIFIFSGIVPNLTAQNVIENNFNGKSEVYFQFKVSSMSEVSDLTQVVSIDRVDGNTVTAVANPSEFAAFLKYGIPYQIIPSPNEGFEAFMLDSVNIRQIEEWDFYPTYPAYESMMYQFQNDYPALCTIHNIGTLNSGRKLLGARITSPVSSPENKPQFLYSATMHGDETTGYILSLRLIYTLLTSYGSNPKLTRLVDSLDIWIFPLANPDGTYKGGNNTVNGAVRYNANNVDLNRNYPDPRVGNHPDGNPWQPETLAFMNFSGQHHFRMGANMHGGAEVCNYPWDTWTELHPDTPWWIYVCREYADTAQYYSPSGYFTYLTGVTNGAAWYVITGGRQDYMNYFRNCREFTLELSNTKLLPPSQLPSLWNYNYRSLINYMEQALYGLRGTITDAVTGQPVHAKVFISGHDQKNSHVFSHPVSGAYSRYLSPGTYTVTYSAPCYESVQHTITVANRQTTWKNITMLPLALQANLSASATSIDIGGTVNFSDQSCGNVVSWNWTFEGGNPSSSTLQNPTVTYTSQGAFDVSLTVSDGTNTHSITLPDYIKVGLKFLMGNGSITTCHGDFYDSGGSNANYSNNENYVLTMIPATTGAKLKLQFTMFDVESHATCNYDWLKIYDGTTTSAPLIGTYCGTNSPGTVTATNPSGALTFHFKSDNSINKAGWAAEITCNYPGTAPIVDFVANKTQILQNDTVQFTDLSSGNPTQWQWTFPGGVPQTSNLQNPQVKYPVPGIYSVILTASNQYGSNTMTKQNYIIVEEGVGGITQPGRGIIVIKPNPVRGGRAEIQCSRPGGYAVILNLMGQELKRFTINDYSTLLDVNDLPAGIYMVRFIGDNSCGNATFELIR